LIEQSVARTGTSHHRADADFLNIMAEDFGVSYWELNQAFGGFPATPKKQALEIAFWAADRTGDPEERGRMIRAWSRKHGHGFYRASQHDQEPPTYGGFDPAELQGV
jgi:hypothetical protein